MDRVVQIEGQARIHKAFGGPGVLRPARDNAHDALATIGKCFGGGDDPHSEDCGHATKLLEDLRAIIGGR